MTAPEWTEAAIACDGVSCLMGLLAFIWVGRVVYNSEKRRR